MASCLRRTLRNVSSIKEQVKELDYFSDQRLKESSWPSRFIEYRSRFNLT